MYTLNTSFCLDDMERSLLESGGQGGVSALYVWWRVGVAFS